MTTALLSSGRLGIRAAQALCGVLGMIFTSLGYIKFTSGQLSSGAAIYTTITCYSAMLCGLYYVIPVGVLKWTSSVPKVLYQRLVDGILAIALLVAGIVHASSTAVKDCSSYNTMFETYHGSALFRCGNMTVAIILTFVACALFLATLVWSFVRDTWKSVNGDNLQAALADNDAQANGYMVASTPGKKDLNGAPTTVDLDLQHPALKVVRCTGRTLQFASSVVAFVCIVMGYKHYYTGQYIEPKATYAILMAYSAVLYSLWHMVAVETLKLSRHPVVGVDLGATHPTRIIMSDFVGAGTYLIAGAKFPNMFIDLNNGNKQDGTKLSAWDNSKSANAHWQVVYANVGKTGKEEYLLLNRASGTYLTVSDKGKEVTCTTQSPLNDVTRWNIIPLRNGTGRYWIAPVSNKTLGLHMAGGNGSKGSQIHIWSAAGDANEMSQWYLYAVEGVPQNFPDTAKGSPPK